MQKKQPSVNLDPECHKDKLLQLQAQHSEFKGKISEIEMIISDHEERIVDAQKSIPSTIEFDSKRETLLADIATGSAKEEDLKELDKQISEHKKDVLKATEEAKEITSKSTQTIAGLKRRLEPLEQQLDALEKRLIPQVKGLFLHSQAEEVGREYVAAAKQLVEKYKQLRGYDHLLSTFNSFKKINSGRSEIEIPLFSLEACLCLERPGRGYHYSYRPSDYQEVVRSADQLKAEFEEAGLHI